MWAEEKNLEQQHFHIPHFKIFWDFSLVRTNVYMYIRSMVIHWRVKRNLKWYARRKKFSWVAKLSNSPYHNIFRLFLGTYTCIDIHTFHGNEFVRKRNLKWYAWRKKFLHVTKISYSTFQNARSFLCTYIYIYICIYVPWHMFLCCGKGGDIFK